MSDYTVATTAQLLAVAQKAVAGDVIKLAPGNYSGVNLTSINPSGAVTITSADPANPAVFTDMFVSGSSNLAISSVVMQVQASSTSFFDFNIQNAANISVSNVVFNGTGMAPLVDTTGLQVRNSTGVSVSNSEFKNLVYGVSFLDNANISVTNSTFHDIRTDGIRGGGNSQVYYGYNFFTNFHPKPLEHADAIQFWTTNTSTAETDITVTGNVYVRGDTGTTVHGIFFRDALGIPFQNVKVTDNLILGSNFNGLNLDGVASGVVSGNSVIAYNDFDSWIRTANNGTELKIFGNTAFKYVTQFNELADNVTAPAVSDCGRATLETWSNGRKLPGDFNNWAELAEDVGVSWTAPVTTAAEPTTTEIIAPPVIAPPVIVLPVTELVGTAGNDVLTATDSIVTVNGGDGDDTLHGNGKAALNGGAGNDHFVLKLAGDTVSEATAQGIDTVTAWFDATLGANVENLTLAGTAKIGNGNALANTINGSANADTLRGYFGDDKLWGNDGNDLMFGDAGNDVLNGGLGNDRLNGGAGKDILTGGAGSDTFMFDSNAFSTQFDELTDFQRGFDKIDLSAIDALSRTTANEAFRYIGASGFSGKGGEIKAVAYEKGMLVTGDVNGDRVADFSILVHNATKLAATDFVL